MASVDRGPSEYAGVTTSGFTAAGATTVPTSDKSSYNRTTTFATIENDKGPSATGNLQAVGSSTISGSGPYKNTGYYATGAVWESWLTYSVPATTAVNPNTSHTLTYLSHEQLL